MRFINKIKQKIKDGILLVYDFSTGQVGAAIGSTLATTYYLRGVLDPIGSTVAYAISLTLGSGIGIVTVYAAEKDNKKQIAELKAELSTEEKTYSEFCVEYFTLQGKHTILNEQQISEMAMVTLLSKLQNISIKINNNQLVTQEDLKIPPPLRRIATLPTITGGAGGRPVDALQEIFITLPAKRHALTTHNNELPVSGFLKKFWLFFRNSTALPKVVMLSYAAMISYYLQPPIEEAGADRWVAWWLSIVLAMILSPLAVYFTTSSSRDELRLSRAELKLVNDVKIEFQNGVSRLKHSLDELKALRADLQPTYLKLLEQIGQQNPEQIDHLFLQRILQQLESLNTRQHSQREMKNTRTTPSIPIQIPPLSELTPATPLLWRERDHSAVELTDLNINNPPPTSASQSTRFCPIL